MIRFIIKFILNTILVYIISVVLLYILTQTYDGLMLVFAFFGIVYAPIGGLILSAITSKYKVSKLKYFLLAIAVTVLAFFLGMLIVFSSF